MVKFLRSTDVANILSNKTKEQLLLKEHRSLIEKEVNRKEIKLRNHSIYIDDKLYCKIVDFKLQFYSAFISAISNPEDAESSTPMATDDKSG